MARRHRKRASGKKNAAGYRRKKKNPGRRHYRRNPGMGAVKDWLSLGAGAVIGGVGASQLPQLVLSSSNTGPLGYFANLAATGILAAVAHMAFKGNKALVAGTIAGGVGATIKRIIADYSLLGQYGTALGMGDYISTWDYNIPQLVTGQGFNQLMKPSWANAAASVAAPKTAVNVAGAGGGMSGGFLGRQLY